MGANNLLRRGMRGDLVSQTQTALKDAGYDVDIDGIFGPQTETAVKDYQKNNGLDVDGVVGPQTQSALKGNTGGGGTTNKTNTANKPAGTGFSYKDFSYDDFSYDDYQESETVTAAYAALQEQLAAKPGAYESTWEGQLNSIIDQILNREEFSYDVNSDALYQQYKDQYTQQGKLAMMDTMGQAAAMTGGYGSSYASTAGNQAYQQYLSQLNEVVPELYGMALDKYYRDGEELYNNYSLIAAQEDRDYGRYQDTYDKWLSETGLLYDQYSNERSFDYSVYADDRNFEYGVYSDNRNFDYGIYADDKSYAYNEHRNAIADEQWQAEYDEMVKNNDRQWALEQEQWDLEKQAYLDSARSYSGTTEGGVSYNNGSLTNAQVKELQAALGIEADGYFGPKTREAVDGLSADAAYEKYVGGLGDDDGGTTPTSNITSAIENKAATFESNDDLADWAYGLADAGTITEDEADMLISSNMDHNEKYVDDGAGSQKISYGSMVKSTKGWSVINDGGVNGFWGVNNNAIVKAPNGEQIRLDNLVDRLVKEGMSKKDAKSYVKKLQKNLGI